MEEGRVVALHWGGVLHCCQRKCVGMDKAVQGPNPQSQDYSFTLPEGIGRKGGGGGGAIR